MQPRRFVRDLGLALALLLVAGCTDDPVAHSETVSIKLSGIKEGDIRNSTASEDKSVKDESGNPYKVFIDNARAALGGADPASISLTSAIVRVRADSDGITALEQVFVDLELFASDSATTIPVGVISRAAGSSQDVALLDADLSPIHANMLKGDFRLGVRGTTQATLPAKFDLKLTIDARFRADE